MKKLRQFSVSATLALVLAVTAAAGEIHTGVTTSPAPRKTTQSVTLTECDANAAHAHSPTESHTLGEIALDFIQSVLALF